MSLKTGRVKKESKKGNERVGTAGLERRSPGEELLQYVSPAGYIRVVFFRYI